MKKELSKQITVSKDKIINKPLIIAIIAIMVSLIVISTSIGLYLTHN